MPAVQTRTERLGREPAPAPEPFTQPADPEPLGDRAETLTQEEIAAAAHRPPSPRRSPPVPADRDAPRARARPRYPPAPSGQMSFEDAPPGSD